MASLPPGKRAQQSQPASARTPRLHPLAMIGIILAILVAIPPVGYAIFLGAALVIQPDWK